MRTACKQLLACSGLLHSGGAHAATRARQILMDELVRPERPITDYNTRFSGITAAMMAGVRTTLAEARGRLAALVPAEALLVGHALQNDLVALKLAHGRILDTALLYPHPRVRF